MTHATMGSALQRMALACGLVATLQAMPAPAAEPVVYRCQLNGRSVFQDTPCAGRRTGAGGDATRAASPLPALYAQVRGAEQEQQTLEQLYQRDMAALRTKQSHAPADAAIASEIETTRRAWIARLGQARQHQQAAIERIRTLCPSGSALSAGQTTCSR